MQYLLELNRLYSGDKQDDKFLDMLQSQDYAAKVCQADLEEKDNRFLPEGEDIGQPNSPNYLSSAKSDASCYLEMTPSKPDNQAVFSFDREHLDNISSQSSGEVIRGPDECNSVSEGSSVCLTMDSGSKMTNSDPRPGTTTPTCQQNTTNPPPIRLSDPSSFAHSHKSPHEVLSDLEELDGDLNTSSTCMYTNPQYILLDCSAKAGDDHREASPRYRNIGPGKGNSLVTGESMVS